MEAPIKALPKAEPKEDTPPNIDAVFLKTNKKSAPVSLSVDQGNSTDKDVASELSISTSLDDQIK